MKEEFDIEEIKHYMKLSVREKLAYLEKMNRFLQKITPQEVRMINEELVKEGF